MAVVFLKYHFHSQWQIGDLHSLPFPFAVFLTPSFEFHEPPLWLASLQQALIQPGKKNEFSSEILCDIIIVHTSLAIWSRACSSAE